MLYVQEKSYIILLFLSCLSGHHYEIVFILCCSDTMVHKKMLYLSKPLLNYKSVCIPNTRVKYNYTTCLQDCMLKAK